WSCATSQRRKCRCRRSAWRSPPMATRLMSKKIGASTRKNSISPTRSSAIATVTGGPPAASFCGSTAPRRAARGRGRRALGARGGAARRAGPLSRARPSRRLESRARLHSRRHGAGPGHNGTGAPPPRRGAGLRDVMAAIDRGLDSLSFLSDAMRDALRRRLRELGGLTLIVLATLVALALATWSVQDPSLSHATNAHVRNILGVSGAIVADLLTQLFGLAALAFILPIAIWGWRLVTHRPMQRERVRLLFWLLGVLLTASCAAALPRSSAWPLPVGLGGVIGDWMLRLPALLSGGTLAGPAGIAVAVAAGAGMLLCFAVAAGFGWRADGGDADGPLEEDDARGSISLGWITHGFLSLKARLARALTRRPSARAPARSETPLHDR